MAPLSTNAEISRRNSVDISKLTHWILESGATCHMKPYISDLIPGSLAETDKYIEVADGHFVTVKQEG